MCQYFRLSYYPSKTRSLWMFYTSSTNLILIRTWPKKVLKVFGFYYGCGGDTWDIERVYWSVCLWHKSTFFWGYSISNTHLKSYNPFFNFEEQLFLVNHYSIVNDIFLSLLHVQQIFKCFSHIISLYFLVHKQTNKLFVPLNTKQDFFVLFNCWFYKGNKCDTFAYRQTVTDDT